MCSTLPLDCTSTNCLAPLPGHHRRTASIVLYSVLLMLFCVHDLCQRMAYKSIASQQVPEHRPTCTVISADMMIFVYITCARHPHRRISQPKKYHSVELSQQRVPKEKTCLKVKPCVHVLTCRRGDIIPICALMNYWALTAWYR